MPKWFYRKCGSTNRGNLSERIPPFALLNTFFAKEEGSFWRKATFAFHDSYETPIHINIVSQQNHEKSGNRISECFSTRQQRVFVSRAILNQGRLDEFFSTS